MDSKTFTSIPKINYQSWTRILFVTSNTQIIVISIKHSYPIKFACETILYNFDHKNRNPVQFIVLHQFFIDSSNNQFINMIPLITSYDNTRPKITNDHTDNKRWFLFNKNHNQSLIGSNSTREQNWLGRSKSIWWPKLKNRTESISESNINYCGLKKWTVNRPVGVKNKIESNKWTKSREIDPLTSNEWSHQSNEQKN